MEIILLDDIDKLGYKHDVVTVKAGFGRNYLIPKKMALIANKSNLARLAELQKQDAVKESKLLGHYQELATVLEGKTLKIGAKAGSSGKIFGSVTNLQIASALNEQLGVEVQRKKIELPESVKVLGTYTAQLHLHPEVETAIDFEVVQE
jgi:large subunit ribosomal protein L9